MKSGSVSPRVVLDAESASHLMTPNPISLRADASLTTAIAFLLDRDFGAAPVIDDAGRPVGVLSLSDILAHHRRQLDFLGAAPEDYPVGGRIEMEFTNFRVSEIMTPLTYTVSVEIPAVRVLEEMVGMRVHHLYVVDGDGTLIGTISSGDILRRLRPTADD